MEKLSSSQHLGFVVLALIASYAIQVLVCCFSILSIPLNSGRDITAVAFFAVLGVTCAVLGVLLLLQLSSIDELANNRHVQTCSVVSAALKHLGHPSANMTERARLAHQSFLLYTRDNVVGISPFGVNINSALVSQVALKVLIGIPVAISALKSVIVAAET